MDPALLDLPWHLPLEDWPKDNLAALPRGISRHVVRFARMGDSLIAIKETSEHVARQEYHMLRKLRRLNVPCVAPVAVITGRHDADGEELQPGPGDQAPALLAAIPGRLLPDPARGHPHPPD